jgi:hypothetical protein
MRNDFEFSLIVPGGPMDDDQILDAADSLGEAGCTDASVRGHSEGMELLFERTGDSLQAAIASAISDVERAGLSVARVEMARDAALQAG